MQNQKAPNPVDRHVGARVRMRRLMMGMSQERLGESLGITFQQIQKYEKGTNRISVSRLQQIANVLGVAITFLYEGNPGLDSGGERADPQIPALTLALSDPLTLRLATSFSSISASRVRRQVVELVEAIAASPIGNLDLSDKTCSPVVQERPRGRAASDATRTR